MLFACISFYGQQLYSVIAKNGLVVRDAPSTTGERVGKIPMAKYVWELEKTQIALSIKDGEERIRGNWMKVEFNGNLTGYVFDGYLMPVDSTWQGQDIGCDSGILCNSSFLFDNFEMIIYNYQTEGEESNEGDSLFCYETVFNEVGSKVMEITPNIDVDSIQVLTTVVESITEQYDYMSQEEWNEEKYNNWELNKVTWEGHEDFVPMLQKRNYFAIPETPYESQEEFRKQKMSLRDTLVDRSGESWNVATMVFHEKPCLYVITDVMFKVILFKNGKAIEEKIIVINLSYGC